MARSAHGYVRGSTVKFYEWLEDRSRGKLPEGPPVWICGDCHVGNLGPLADAKGHVLIQIRDLDQTVIGNPAHDLIRLGLSLASASRGSDLPGVTTARVMEELVAGYQAGLSTNFEPDKDRSHRPKSIQSLLARATRRRWRHLAEERLATVKPTIPLGRRFWALTPEERKSLSRNVRKRFTQAYPCLASGPREGRADRAARCRLLDERLQFARTTSLCCVAWDRKRQEPEHLFGGCEGGSNRRGPSGLECRDATG